MITKVASFTRGGKHYRGKFIEKRDFFEKPPPEYLLREYLRPGQCALHQGELLAKRPIELLDLPTASAPIPIKEDIVETANTEISESTAPGRPVTETEVSGPVQTVVSSVVDPNTETSSINERLRLLESIVTKATPNRELAAINERLGQLESILTKFVKSSQEGTTQRQQPSIQVHETWGTNQLGWVFPAEICVFSDEPVPADTADPPASASAKPAPPRLRLPRPKKPSKQKARRSSGTVDDSAEDPQQSTSKVTKGTDNDKHPTEGPAVTRPSAQRRPEHSQPQVTSSMGCRSASMYRHDSPEPTIGALSDHRVADPAQVTYGRDPRQSPSTSHPDDPRDRSVLGSLTPRDGQAQSAEKYLSRKLWNQDARHNSPDPTLSPVSSPREPAQRDQNLPSVASPDPTIPPVASPPDPTIPPVASPTQVPPQPSEASPPVHHPVEQRVGALETQVAAQVEVLRALTNALTSRSKPPESAQVPEPERAEPKRVHPIRNHQMDPRVDALEIQMTAHVEALQAITHALTSRSTSSSAEKPEPAGVPAPEPQAEPKRAPPAPPHSELRADDIFYRKLQSSLGRQLIQKSVDAILEGNTTQTTPPTPPTSSWSTTPVKDFWNEIDGATAAKVVRFFVGSAERWANN